jgi:inner membrane protein involved in colicin E2 resistance
MSSNQLLDPSNVLVLPATIAGSFRNADWEGAAQAGGIAGVVAEALQAATGTNTEPFFVATSSDWKIHNIQALLLRYGIKLWGVGYFNNELFFRVKGRQAHWAQYVLLRAGVPLLHGLLDGSRAIPRYNQEADPAPSRTGPVDGLLDWAGRLLGL